MNLDIVAKREGLLYALNLMTENSKHGLYYCKDMLLIGNDINIDYITKDTKGIIRCYEIKTTIDDFKEEFNARKMKKLYGDFFYYVMNEELYKSVKSKLKDNVGVYVYDRCVKYPKRRKPTLEEKKLLNDSMVRHLFLINKTLPKNAIDTKHRLASKSKELNRLRRIERKYLKLKMQCLEFNEEYFSQII